MCLRCRYLLFCLLDANVDVRFELEYSQPPGKGDGGRLPSELSAILFPQADSEIKQGRTVSRQGPQTPPTISLAWQMLQLSSLDFSVSFCASECSLASRSEIVCSTDSECSGKRVLVSLRKFSFSEHSGIRSILSARVDLDKSLARTWRADSLVTISSIASCSGTSRFHSIT